MEESDQIENQVEDEDLAEEEEEYEHDETEELVDEVEPSLGKPNGVKDAEDDDDELGEEEDDEASEAPELEQEGHIEEDKMDDEDNEVDDDQVETEGQENAESEQIEFSAGEAEEDEGEIQLQIDNVEGAHNIDAAGRKRSASAVDVEEGPKSKVGRNEGNASNDEDGEDDETEQKQDAYCWVCHKAAATYNCKMCPRSYHSKCFSVSADCPQPMLDEGDHKCVCPECVLVMNAEEYEKRSDAMKQVNMEQLTNMLKLICRRMKEAPGSDPFQRPVLSSEAPDYYDFVVYPMDIQTLEANVDKRQYGSPEAFLADAQWIVHNSVVFNSPTSPYSHTAKRILKVCKTELAEIEACPECYMNAHEKPDSWFTDACKRPHLIVWAKLKGFPFWPAKAMKIKNDQVDARFFGQHDKSWVALKDCFLYSEEMPSNTKKNANLLAAVDELNMHLDNLREMFGEVTLAAPKTPLGRELSTEEIRKLVPGYNPDAPSPKAAGSKAAKAEKKSPLTLKITSIKSKPTVAQNQSVEEADGEKSRKPLLRAKRPSETSNISSNSNTSEATKSASKVPVLPEETATIEADEKKDTDEDIEEESEKLEVEPSVPNGEILANALGLKPKRRSSVGSSSMANDTRTVDDEDKLADSPASKRPDVSIPQGTSILQQRLNKEPVKQETSDTEDVSLELDNEDIKPKKNIDFMEHFSNQAQTKPGTRINISKDISISAVGKDEDSDDEPMDTYQRKPNAPNSGLSITSSMLQARGENFGNNQRMHQGGSSSKGPNRFGPPRFLNPGGESKILSKMLKPSHGVPIPGAKHTSQFQHRPLRAVPGALPADKAMKHQPSTTHLLQKLAKEGSMGGKSSTSTSQAITLPGGTITVTPLAPGKSADTPPPLKPAINGPDQGSRKSVKAPANRSMSSSMVPGSVVQTVQTLQNNISEMVRTAAESIARDMVDHISRGDDNKGYKQENERLKKELVDLRRSNEVLMKEVLAQKEADKKRTVAELRHFHERDKGKAVEQAKRKQWCANCLQESSLYCCWNTSYCGYNCQASHWSAHMPNCAQNTGGK